MLIAKIRRPNKLTLRWLYIRQERKDFSYLFRPPGSGTHRVKGKLTAVSDSPDR